MLPICRIVPRCPLGRLRRSSKANVTHTKDPSPANFIAFVEPFKHILQEMPEYVGAGCLGGNIL